ncbi:peptidoglycan-binding domain-containing protein [Roseovarius sp. C7]|uniref:peptidoglycan-binding domain-containing protein n=1 Tax=Roseovarius sp. C7 TaxID=3398643 RepID=UPI0039F68294
MIRHLALTLCLALPLAGCQMPQPPTTPGIVETLAEAPPGAPPGSCWGKLETPAVIETVTDQVLVQPAVLAEDGSVRQPASYRTDTRQEIVKEREVTWFETPCAADMTPEFVSSVQRALKVRALYRGTISGQMDARTRAAVRAYQTPHGLNSGILSLESARRLGLVAIERPEAG